MNLTEKPEIVTWQPTHYVFVEATGSIPKIAPGVWQTLHKGRAGVEAQCKISGAMSLYKIEPTGVYRAGFIVDQKPEKLPEGFAYEKFEGGKYSRFVLTGSYEQLPQASGRVHQIARETKIPQREAFYIENYVSDPRSTPTDRLVTEILIPTK